MSHQNGIAFFDDLLAGLHTGSVTEPAVLVREVRMRIGVLPRIVTVRIYYTGKGAEPYSFDSTASMKTGCGHQSPDAKCTAPSEADALRRAVRMLTEDYEIAIRNGELPEDSWLIENERR